MASRQGDIFLSTWGGGYLDGVLIHNNTTYWPPSGNSPALVNGAEFTGERPNIFANNIIVSTVPWMVDGGSDLSLDHNLYWLAGEGEPFFYFDQAYYTGFDEYRDSSGHDVNSIYVDPLLNNFTYHEINMPEDAFTLQANSPAIDAGADLGLMGARDFFGNHIPYGDAYDIGAHEWTPKESGGLLPFEIAAALASLQPLLNESEGLLVGLVDPHDEASRSQVVFLRSMARQFANSGLRVVMVDVSGLVEAERANLSYDWHMDEIPLLAGPTDLEAPLTLLYVDGSPQYAWDGVALPYTLAVTLQENLQHNRIPK